MPIYYLRTIPADYEQMIAIGKTLGAIVEIDGVISAPNGCWDYIGPIYRRAGGTDDEPVMESLKDADGNEYIHINLATPVDLAEAAAELAAEHPEVADGLANLGKYFLLDAEGNTVPPANPHRVFAS